VKPLLGRWKPGFEISAHSLEYLIALFVYVLSN
jgi:hypothetical protein